ncbi:hypothetical protein [endosymbiont GvMRE of Glomus versiforme]|nr:hypothetical protein [endosymbiont GvMRE of Glomus versiforme]
MLSPFKDKQKKKKQKNDIQKKNNTAKKTIEAIEPKKKVISINISVMLV